MGTSRPARPTLWERMGLVGTCHAPPRARPARCVVATSPREKSLALGAQRADATRSPRVRCARWALRPGAKQAGSAQLCLCVCCVRGALRAATALCTACVRLRTVDRGLLSQPAHPRRICTALRLPGSCLCSPNVAANVAAGASAIALASPVLRLTLHYSSPRMAPFLRMAGCVAQAYLAAELAWYCFCESEKKRFEPLVQHATITATQRQVLWQRCLKWSENRRLWLQGWFNNIDTFERITRPDILDFLAWGFWGIRARELAPSDSKQLETMVSELETSVSTAAAHYTFPARGTA